jgi:hypothetical protein
VTCSGGNDGSVEIQASNAVGTPMYALNSGAFQASNKFTGLSANNYSVSVKDGNGCIGTGSATVASNPVITGAISISTAISCNGSSNGALNLTPGGGVAPYTFLWSNGATSEDISGLSANGYSVSIKDSKGCEKAFSRTLTQPQPITIDGVVSDYNGSAISCFGGTNGSVNASVTGGNTGYVYSWSNGKTTEDISNLSAGSYTLTVTDNKSCSGTKTFTLSQPSELSVSVFRDQME